jgi:hypothetical protein
MAHSLKRRQRGSKALSQLDLKFGGHAVAGAARSLAGDCRGDGGIGVAQHQRAPGTDVIDIRVAVGVPQPRA